jgi:hypothetical protein
MTENVSIQGAGLILAKLREDAHRNTATGSYDDETPYSLQTILAAPSLTPELNETQS